MELFKNSSSVNLEDNTKLLFFENFKLEKSQYNIEEIFFQKPVLLQQIRILKAESNPHPKIKSQLSITQSQPIHNFEMFGRNLKKPSDKFETLLENSTINTNMAQTDCIIPFLKEFMTNHLIIRGNWERMTLCIYGLPAPPTEAHKLMEQAKTDVSLESLIKQGEAENPENVNFTKEEIELLSKYKVDQLISPYIKCELMDDFRKAYFLNPPNLSMIEKTRTGYIYYEKELNFCIHCLNNFYLFDPKACKNQKLTVNSQGYLYLSAVNGEDQNGANIEELNIINYQSLCKKLIDLITKLISNNNCFLENECVFNKDNYQIYLKFPEMLVDIIINGLFGKLYGFIEIRYALKMLKLISNSAYFTELFVEKNGMELLYSLLVGRENTYFFNPSTNNTFANMLNGSNSINQQANSSIIKIAVLENIYKLITHKSAFNRFIENNEKNKDNQIYFMIKDFLKENEKENLQTNFNANATNTNFSANASFNMGAGAQAEHMQNLTGGASILNAKSESKTNAKQEKEDNSREDDAKENAKRKDKDRKSRKSKKKSKRERRNSRSRSRSRSKSKSKSRTHSRSKESQESDHSVAKKKSNNNLNIISNTSNLNANSSSGNLSSGLNAATATAAPALNSNVNTNTILKNGYQICLALVTLKKNNVIFNLIQKILSKVTFIVYLKELGHITELLIANDQNNLNLYTEKISYYLEKIFESIEKYDVAYKKNFPRDNDCTYSEDYPFKQFWVDYLKLGRKTFNKTEVINEKSFMNNEKNSSNKFTEFKIITNDLAIIFEEFELIENLIELMTNPNIQRMNNYTENCILIKTIILEILLAKGGINFFSKNFDLAMILRNYLIRSTDSLVNDPFVAPLIEEENFFTFTLNKDISFGEKSEVIKNLYQRTKESSLNKILINVSDNYLLDNEFIIKINHMQLRHILDLSFMYLSKLDYFINFKQEETDFIDKSLEILIIISQRITKSNISKQAFLSVFQNEYYIEQFLSLLKLFTEEDSTEYEAHITLLSEILFEIFNENSRYIDEILFLFGPSFYDVLSDLKNKLSHIYDTNEIDPINKNIFASLDGLINMLRPAKALFEEKNIDTIVNSLNESVYNNVQKYNLNVKCINDENVKESIRDYVKGMKMNIINHENSDTDYLDSIKSRGSLINEIFVAVKLVNLSIRINPLLLIDCVRRHIHLTIRYLIINTVNSLKALLNTNIRHQSELKNECDKYKKIKEYSILLSNLYEILGMLLKNLLSSHVDNYRDSAIIDNTINLIIILTNYLYENSRNNSTKNASKETNINSNENQNENQNFAFSEENYNSCVIEYLQNLLQNALNTFKEMCKFNTSIKLNFERILEKLAEKPSNKGPMIYVLNFMLNVVNNEYTIETFFEHFRKTQKKLLVDVYNEIEYNIKAHPVRLSNLFEEKNLIKYVIEIGANCENEWIVENAAKLLLTMQRSYVTKSKENMYQEISEALISSLNTTFNKITKIECLTILNEKEIENTLPLLDSLLRHLNFLLYFLKSEYKFIYIFYDLASKYLTIYNYFKSYLQLMDFFIYETDTQMMKTIKNINLDIIIMLLESFTVLCDSEQGYYKYIKEESQSSTAQNTANISSLSSNLNMSLNNPNQSINYYYSNFVEEMPNKEQILAIVKSSRYLLEFILNTVAMDNNNNIENDIQMPDSRETANRAFIKSNKHSVYLDKAILISNKILRLYINLSRNFYGQSIILHSEFEVNGIVTPLNLKANPSLNLCYLHNFIASKLSNFEIDSNNKFSVNLFEITHNYLMVILLSFYDCLYFEYASNYLDGSNVNSSNTLLSNNIFTADFLSDFSAMRCVVTDNHIAALLSSILGMEINKDNIYDASKNIQEMFISLNNYLENISSKYYRKNSELYNEFNFTSENFNNLNNTNFENNGNNEGMGDNNEAGNEENNMMDTENQETSEKNNYNNLKKNNGNKANGNLNQNSDSVDLDINNLESEKDFNNQRDEITNLIDTEMNTNNQNVSTNNFNTPNNNYIDLNQNNAPNSFESIVSRQKSMHLIQSVLEKLNLIKRNNSLIIRLLSVSPSNNSFVFLDVVDSETLNKSIKLPNTRKIYEKCEMINKYYEFIQTQSLDFNLPIQTQSTQNQAQSQILNPLLNNLNNPNAVGNSSPTNASTAPSNIFSSTNMLNNPNASSGAAYSNIQNPANPHNSLINKLSELGFGRHHIIEFEKLLNWKKYRIYLAKMDTLKVRKDLFDLDSSLKILPEEKLLKQLNEIDFSLLYNSNFMNKLFTYVNLDSFQQFCNILSNENLIVEKYSNIAYSVNKNFLNKRMLYTDLVEFEGEEVFEQLVSGLTCYKYEFEFYKVASGKNLNLNLAKFGSGIKTIGVLSLTKNNNSKKKKISSKINLFIYKPNFEKYAKQMIIYHPTPMTAPLRENRQASIVSGRTISTHLDSFKPDQAVVTAHYTDSINKESNSSNLNDQISNSNTSMQNASIQANAASSNFNSASNPNIAAFTPNKPQIPAASHINAFSADSASSASNLGQISGSNLISGAAVNVPIQANMGGSNANFISHFDNSCKKDEDSKLIDMSVDSNAESVSNPILNLGGAIMGGNSMQNQNQSANLMMGNTNPTSQNFFSSNQANLSLPNAQQTNLNMNTALRQNSGGFNIPAANNMNMSMQSTSNQNQNIYSNQMQNQNFNNINNQNTNPTLNIGMDKGMKMQPPQSRGMINNPNMNQSNNPNMNNMNFNNINPNINQGIGMPPNQNMPQQHGQNPNNMNMMGMKNIPGNQNMSNMTNMNNYAMPGQIGGSNMSNYMNQQQGNMGNMMNPQPQGNAGYNPYNLYQGNFNQNPSMNPNMGSNTNLNPNPNMNLNQQGFPQRGMNPNMNPVNMNKPNMPFSNQGNPNMAYNQTNSNMQPPFNQFAQQNIPAGTQNTQMPPGSNMMGGPISMNRNQPQQQMQNLNTNVNTSNQITNQNNPNANQNVGSNATLNNMSSLFQLAKKLMDQKNLQNQQASGQAANQDQQQSIGTEQNINVNPLLSIAQKTANQPEGLKDPRIRKKK